MEDLSNFKDEGNCGKKVKIEADILIIPFAFRLVFSFEMGEPEVGVSVLARTKSIFRTQLAGSCQ